jgi:uncharacterized protein YjbJ (UPF0337 family)
MNIDTLAGEGTDLKGRLKTGLGDATGDQRLQQDGMVDQLSGQARKSFGAVRDFATRQPLATAVAGVAALALLSKLGGGKVNTGRRSR